MYENPFKGYCAKGRCKTCGMVLESERPGHFVSCPCGNAVDTDRWDHRSHRFIGDVENLQTEACACSKCHA